MCNWCMDADKKDKMRDPDCSGIIEKPFATVEELKCNLFYEWMVTGKNHFRIMKAAIKDVPKKQINWLAQHFESGKSARILVEFI